MKKRDCAFLILLSLLAGCATPVPPVATYTDTVSGLRTDFIPENLLESKEPSRELVWLNASRVFTDVRNFTYYLEVHYQATSETGWLDILPGKTLVVLADGQEMRFPGLGSLNTRKEKKGIVMEDAIYETNAAALRAIANAQKLTVKVIGKNAIVVRDFAPANFEKFKKFVAEYVDGGR
ncbi:MAG: hypothetical protein AAB676_21935 [Verrucomicrobiota bacterium]